MPKKTPQLPRLISPWLREPDRWLTVVEASIYYNRTPRRIRQWCSRGEIFDFGIRVHQDQKGRYWLRLP